MASEVKECELLCGRGLSSTNSAWLQRRPCDVIDDRDVVDHVGLEMIWPRALGVRMLASFGALDAAVIAAEKDQQLAAHTDIERHLDVLMAMAMPEQCKKIWWPRLLTIAAHKIWIGIGI